MAASGGEVGYGDMCKDGDREELGDGRRLACSKEGWVDG